MDEALDWVFEQTGTVVPLADFLYADSYARLMEDVQRGVYLGIHEAAGVKEIGATRYSNAATRVNLIETGHPLSRRGTP